MVIPAMTATGITATIVATAITIIIADASQGGPSGLRKVMVRAEARSTLSQSIDRRVMMHLPANRQLTGAVIKLRMISACSAPLRVPFCCCHRATAGMSILTVT